MKLLYICLILLTVSCRGDKNKYNFDSPEIKEFYTDCNGMDYIRFPLIMPYDVMCINLYNKQWFFRLRFGTEFYSSIKVKKVAVINNSIIAINCNELKEWFVIIPSKNIEIGFEKESEFKDYVKQCGAKEIKWIETNNAYHLFKDTECLPWIPGCI